MATMFIKPMVSIIAALLMGTLCQSTSQVPSKEDLRGLNLGLVKSLDRMVKVDQELRSEMAKASFTPNNQQIPEIVRRLEAIDRHNTNQMRQIVKTYGWPTSKLVGKKGANDAWLLVQHADQNPKFQRECLDLMQPLVAKGEVGKQNFAYLTDRVLLAEGKKQVYGTQFTKGANGDWEPRPLDDPDNVDKRRLEMGLNTMADYRKMIEEMYGKKPPLSKTSEQKLEIASTLNRNPQ